MSLIKKLICSIFLISLFSNTSFSVEPRKYTVITKATHGGFYEKGKFHKSKPQFQIRYIVDEINNKVTRTEVLYINNNKLVEDSTNYVITNITPSILTLEKEKIITAVGIPGTVATELIHIGETFFYWTKTIKGRIYLQYGKVIKETKY